MNTPIVIRETGEFTANISELNFARLPQESFNSYNSPAGEPLTRFCSETIWLTICYLVFCGVLRIVHSEERKRFLFIRYRRKRYLVLSGDYAQSAGAYLEDKIISLLARCSVVDLSTFVSRLLDELNQEKIPGICSRGILLRIAIDAMPDLILYKEPQLFGTKYTVVVNNKQAAARLYDAELQLQSEFVRNYQFGQFAESLYRTIHSMIINLQSD